jgi:ribosomal protein S18 acetylase RimI-like enzyme
LSVGWQNASRRDYNDVLAYLRLREWSCVSFTSRLVNRGDGGNRVFVNRSEDSAGSVQESLLMTDYGLVLPALDTGGGDRARRKDELLPLLYSQRKSVHSVMGVMPQVGAFTALLTGPKDRRIDYHLMTREHFNLEEPSDVYPGLVIRRGAPQDLKALFPLHRDYELEEVLLRPERFNASASLLFLQRALKHEIVYFAEMNGTPVAKASTNARGLSYYQIGGVYTIPSLRGKGIARVVMRRLMWEVARAGKHMCLFVKKDNVAAIRLYEHLGFIVRDSFAIQYYRS